jgi:hypothetical protein
MNLPAIEEEAQWKREFDSKKQEILKFVEMLNYENHTHIVRDLWNRIFAWERECRECSPKA